MCLYLSLSALHVSDCLVHHQERRFGAVYRNFYKLVRLAVATQQPDIGRNQAHTFIMFILCLKYVPLEYPHLSLRI